MPSSSAGKSGKPAGRASAQRPTAQGTTAPKPQAKKSPASSGSGSGSGGSAVASAAQVGEDAIRRRAQQIYELRCRDGLCGDSLSDWLQAERELRRS